MQRQRYTDEQKTEALRLLAEHGQAEAARRTGISPGTIGSWATRAGVAGDTSKTRSAVERKQLTVAQRRAELGERFLTTAEAMLDDADEEETAIDRKRLVESARIAAETSNLLLGEATARVDAMNGSPREQAIAVVHQIRQRQTS